MRQRWRCEIAFSQIAIICLIFHQWWVVLHCHFTFFTSNRFLDALLSLLLGCSKSSSSTSIMNNLNAFHPRKIEKKNKRNFLRKFYFVRSWPICRFYCMDDFSVRCTHSDCSMPNQSTATVCLCVCAHGAEDTTVVSTLRDDSSTRQSMEKRSSGGSIWKQTNCVSTEYITLHFPIYWNVHN